MEPVVESVLTLPPRWPALETVSFGVPIGMGRREAGGSQLRRQVAQEEEMKAWDPWEVVVAVVAALRRYPVLPT